MTYVYCETLLFSRVWLDGAVCVCSLKSCLTWDSCRLTPIASSSTFKIVYLYAPHSYKLLAISLTTCFIVLFGAVHGRPVECFLASSSYVPCSHSGGERTLLYEWTHRRCFALCSLGWARWPTGLGSWRTFVELHQDCVFITALVFVGRESQVSCPILLFV